MWCGRAPVCAPTCLCVCVCAPCLSDLWHNGINAGVVEFERQDKVLLTDLPPYLLEERFLLAHLSWRLMGELIVYQSLRGLSSVRQNFQTSSLLKPQGQFNSNFIWRLLRTRERKFVQMVMVTWPRWPPRPYMVKTLYNLLLQNQKAIDLGTWYVALGMWGLPSLFKWWS